MPQDFRPTRMRLQRDDLQVRTRGDLAAILWRDKQDQPADGNFRDSNDVIDANCGGL
jgi:hypothetical protein